jgi:heme a synthase
MILRTTDPDRAVRWWLYVIAAMIALTAIVGAATRLTGSGLSITEWNVIGGVIPPLSEAHWQEAFDKYRQIPQYREINRGMSLDAFKVIYWWEWVHRMLGRGIGLVFAVPFAVFALTGRLRAGLSSRLLLLLALGGLQGAVGWYMVSSGLIGRTDVSQYRLALHLTLAVLIYMLTLWTAFELSPARDTSIDLATVSAGQKAVAVLLMPLVLLQVALGALVAGLKAGKTHNTWPLMDGSVVPGGMFKQSPWWANVFENATTVQFNHRLLAYVIVAVTLWHAVVLVRSADAASIRRSSVLVATVTLAQTALGVWTLLAWVPLDLGLAHQAGALALVAAVAWNAHLVRRSRSRR